MVSGWPETGRLVVTPKDVWLRPTWPAVQASTCWGSPFTCQNPVLSIQLGDAEDPVMCFISLACPVGGPWSLRAPGGTTNAARIAAASAWARCSCDSAVAPAGRAMGGGAGLAAVAGGG